MNLESKPQTAATAPSHGKTLVMLMAITVVIGIFIWLCYLLRVTEFWSGFLFVLYWGMMEHADSSKLPKCIVGSLLGLLMGYLMQALPLLVGPSGGLIFLALVLLLIYCQLMGWFPIAVNAMTMIFLTVGTIPLLQSQADFIDVLMGLVMGIVFFGGLISAGKLIKQRAGRI